MRKGNNPWLSSRKSLIYILSLITLMVLGTFGFWAYQEKLEKVTSGAEKRIAFLKGNGQNEKEAEIWVIEANGSDEENTNLKFKNGENFSSFHQSPDTNYACFTDGDLEVGQEIYLLDVRKNEIKQISDSFFKATESYDGSDLWDCAWSLDSKKIAYRVTHGPQENLPGGGLPQKSLPPKKFEEKMGGFLYDIIEGKLERVESDAQIGLSSSWRPESEGWDEPLLKEFFFENSYSWGAKLLKRQGLAQPPLVIYKTEHYLGSASPLQISPNKTKAVFADYDGAMVVFNIKAPANLQRFEMAKIDGSFSKYEWLSNNEILFWQSQGGHKYNTDHGSWYQGNFLVLNIQTGKTRKLTNDNRAFWRQ